MDYTVIASTPGKLKSLPDHGGYRTRDLWDASPNTMLYLVAQLVENWISIPLRYC